MIGLAEGIFPVAWLSDFFVLFLFFSEILLHSFEVDKVWDKKKSRAISHSKRQISSFCSLRSRYKRLMEWMDNKAYEDTVIN